MTRIVSKTLSVAPSGSLEICSTICMLFCRQSRDGGSKHSRSVQTTQLRRVPSSCRYLESVCTNLLDRWTLWKNFVYSCVVKEAHARHNNVSVPTVSCCCWFVGVAYRSSIMETAPCETDPFKPHLYSKKGVWGGKVKIINNVCNCGFQE